MVWATFEPYKYVVTEDIQSGKNPGAQRASFQTILRTKNDKGLQQQGDCNNKVIYFIQEEKFNFQP